MNPCRSNQAHHCSRVHVQITSVVILYTSISNIVSEKDGELLWLLYSSRTLFHSEDVVFPPTIVGQSVYQTVVIKIAGKEPTVFNVIEDDK